ncbi:MAG TPA: vitamin K epoxide reductase family protein [Humisphaera sp.]|nr:vitamin K epoxide reductase family protein [Humisphaera sp.]
MTVLSALAFALSSYLSLHYLMGGSVIGCSGGSACEEVLSSRWSAIGGVVPVSGLAAGTYLAILLASFFIGPATPAPDRRLAWSAMLILAAAAAGSAVWFIIVQKWIVGALCPYCIATHITGLLLAALIIWRAIIRYGDIADGSRPNRGSISGAAHTGTAPISTNRAAIAAAAGNPSSADPRPVIGLVPGISLTIIGLALAGTIAVLQFRIAPRAVYRSGRSIASLPVIDPHAVPLVGSPDAPYVVTLLFDYNCPHCQKMYAMLEESISRYNGKLAFALCPAPLNSQCNPYVAQDTEQFKDSCELAKIGLTVWRADREAFAAFDRWMFSPQPGERWRPRALDAAKAKAIELMGQAKFDAARADPWIEQYMQTSIRTFGDTIQNGNAVPKLVFGSRWVTPEPRDADELISILHDSLAVPLP